MSWLGAVLGLSVMLWGLPVLAGSRLRARLGLLEEHGMGALLGGGKLGPYGSEAGAGLEAALLLLVAGAVVLICCQLSFGSPARLPAIVCLVMVLAAAYVLSHLSSQHAALVSGVAGWLAVGAGPKDPAPGVASGGRR